MSYSRKCCCGCSLKAGTAMLLWFTTISFLTLIITTLTHYNKNQHLMNENDWFLEHPFTKAVILNLFAICAFISIIGLYGMHMNKPKFLIPYLIYRIIANICAVLTIFPALMVLFSEPRQFTDFPAILQYPKPNIEQIQAEFSSVLFGFLVIEFVFLIIEIYFIRVIYFCYKLMRQRAVAICTDVIPLRNPQDRINT